jgi:arsenite-transporting ATPase
VHEAERLQRDLGRAGIKPFAWEVDQSLLASGARDPLHSLCAECEIHFIRRVAKLAPCCALVPWLALPPFEIDALTRLARRSGPTEA